ncbi:hypothetical protein LCGC14_2537570 [marine sediment metagenome]|uniref:Uncharacterized protein n=1 Tax=marine sediment metagenome TaxID=412755 RepID=A0A0F9D3B5_9ZZZZ
MIYLTYDLARQATVAYYNGQTLILRDGKDDGTIKAILADSKKVPGVMATKIEYSNQLWALLQSIAQ